MVKSFNLNPQEINNYKLIKLKYDELSGFKLSEKQFFNLLLNLAYKELPKDHEQ